MKLLLLAATLLLASNINAKDVVLDTGTSLLWQDAPDNKDLSITYPEAQEYCSKLVIAEYSDFRLPTLYELQTIVDYAKYKPAILEGFKHVANETYWTTTIFADDSQELWTINFKKGERSVKAKHYDRNVRCVQKLQ
ncbi:MAG: DUF1566 domain-containing protein [Sulfurimonas sp.]|jgi:hypothetical protein|nr:DUF1566 domain-containing protein [Sulfurimonas sp.]MBU1217512.1 DUF1566 domain-containing protein [bacterium]MBU1433778.1 DUF1566 domain-containing protein [bacterium]MBU1503853.1 DUF1566 domain-containing protein [bacterium]MBU3939101.1 DUF1566 domain-containing protein [bacterium]